MEKNKIAGEAILKKIYFLCDFESLFLTSVYFSQIFFCSGSFLHTVSMLFPKLHKQLIFNCKKVKF